MTDIWKHFNSSKMWESNSSIMNFFLKLLWDNLMLEAVHLFQDHDWKVYMVTEVTHEYRWR
jgi:hypothetical protein